MLSLELLLIVGGILHFGLLVAGALLPGKLNWREELKRLQPMSRHIIWVHGAFIVLVIVGFGAVSLVHREALADGSALARSICGFIALFWLVRLGIQFFLFDARPHLTHWFYKAGYHGLTVVFTCLVAIYGLVALG